MVTPDLFLLCVIDHPAESTVVGEALTRNTTVRVYGLRHAFEFNGMCGKCEDWDGDIEC